MRKTTCIDRSWRFCLGDFPAAIAASFDDRSWQELDLPHDWSIESTPHPDNPAQAGGGFFPGGIGWYRKWLDIPAELGDQRILIDFDGVYMNSEVWCNGHFCGRRPYGYSSFQYDLTPYVKPGQPAVVAVRVDNSRQKNSRWYSGSGIYRHVWLTCAQPVRVAHWGTYITTPEVSAERATVACAVSVLNGDTADADVHVCATVLQGPEETTCCQLTTSVHVPAGGTCIEDLCLELPDPALWSPDSPALYTMRVELRCGGRTVDLYDTRFGVRTLRFDSDEGFFLNSRSLKLQGVNEHHDAGCLGAAVPDDVIRRRFRILKEMGCNAVRVAHNPAAPTFLDLCDEFGFMVVEDAFDEWRDGKTPFGYQLYWDQWWERDLVDMMRRDRNHPCIVMWSVGNEIKEVRSGNPAGLSIMAALREVCHREDPTRPMTCGCCNTHETLAAGYGPLMDVMGYNGGGGSCFNYEKDHAAHPGMLIFASEVPHSLQTRGVYRARTWYRDLARNKGNVKWYASGVPDTGPDQSEASSDQGTHPATASRAPLELMHVPDLAADERFPAVDTHYQSSYDNAMVRISSIDSWRLTRDLPFMLGEFRWTGFDYLGECYGWPAKSWNFGVIDLCGFPKDTYYFYQSQWSAKPMVHLLPHWTWPGLEGKTIPVVCYSNCGRVELFLDEVSLGVKEMDPAVMQLRWDVPYQPGVLKAVGYDAVDPGPSTRDDPGGVVAQCVHSTAAAPAALELTCDERTIRADGTGIAHVVVRVVDGQGRLVPDAAYDVDVQVEGPASLIGLENGDPIDTTNYRLGHRRTFNGMLLAVVQASAHGGRATVTVSSDGLKGASWDVDCVSVDRPDE